MDGFSGAEPVGAMERLAECRDPYGRERQPREVLDGGLDEVDRPRPRRRRVSASLGEHVRIRLEQRHVLEQRGELDPDCAGAAADVEEPARPVETQLAGQHLPEPRGVRRPPLEVVPRGTAELGGVVLHPGSLPLGEIWLSRRMAAEPGQVW